MYIKDNYLEVFFFAIEETNYQIHNYIQIYIEWGLIITPITSNLPTVLIMAASNFDHD